MISIPLTSPVDLETENIIQKDFSFKKKNSLVYKGILSNMKYKKGNGFLSTTGKNISSGSSSVFIDGVYYYVSPEGYITESGSETIPSNVIFVRKMNDNLLMIQKVSQNSVVISNKNNSFTVEDSSAVDMNGTITTTGKFIISIYRTSNTTTRVYNTDLSLYNTFTVNKVLGSKAVTSYSADNYTWVGFDSEDMRKRYCYYMTENGFAEKIHGMGMISETGLVTGEPLFYSTASYFSKNHAIIGAGNLNNYSELTTAISSFDYSNSGYQYDKFLDNGIRQTERFDTTLANPHYLPIVSATANDYELRTKQEGQTTVLDPMDLGKSWQNAVSTLQITPTDYRSGSQNGAQSIPNRVGIMDFSPGSNASVGLESYTVIHVYVYAMQISGATFSLKVVPAMRRSPIGEYFSGTDLEKWQSMSRATEISFMNYSNPIGRISESLSDGEQVFPHMRFFGNNTNEKGIYWDYGKGWVRFFYDTIHYVKYDSFGTAIYEEALKIYSFDNSGLKIENVDVQKSSSIYDYTHAESDMNYYKTDDSTVMVPKNWYSSNLSSADSVIGTGKSTPIIRLHPIVAEQLSSSVWLYNHSFGYEIMQDRPFSVSLGQNNGFDVSKQIYNGIATSISVNKTLLFTPHTMEEKYSYNDGYFTIWSSNNVTWAKISSSGTIDVSKMTDYIFKMNVIGSNNVLVEDRYGNFTLQRAFIPYIMDSTINNYIGIDYLMPDDSSSNISNDVYYFGAGFNSTINEKNISTSFLLPAVTIPFYLDTTILQSFNKEVISNKKGIIRADISRYFYGNELVEEYWTHTQATTDVSYKNTKYLVSGIEQNTYDEDYVDTSWIPTNDTIIYPIGILSKIYGENYITSTVDVGDNYVSRFYNKNNKTFLIFNNIDQVYYGSEIFTIQSGNYYFDGQGIYYLGSQSDYTQNVFTAYAIGMRFLANSSSEAYFYSEWDKNIYLYTASNTLQRSISLADMGNVIDSLYSPAEQALYILFDDGKLFIKTQADSCLIENVDGTSLQSTNVGCQIVSKNKYEIYNPYMWNDTLPISIETEWLGNQDTVTKYRYIDVVFYSETPDSYDVTVSVDALNGMEVQHIELPVHISRSDWKNNLYRARVVPKEITGNAIKIYINSNNISIFSVSIDAVQASSQTSAPRNGRY